MAMMMMMKAVTSFLFLSLALLYFSGTCAAFRPPSKEAAFFNMLYKNNKKKHFFDRESSSSCNDFLTLFRGGGGGRSSKKKDIATLYKPTSRSNSSTILLRASAAKDDNETKKDMKYPSNNSIISFIGGTTSIVVATSFFIVLCYFRDASIVSFWLGSIGNAILSKVLKKMINQSRPPELLDTVNDMAVAPSDGGMPSSHAMSLAFIGTTTALLLPSSSNTGGVMIWAALRLTLAVYAAISLFYRVQVKKFHTWEQIAVGVAVGASNAGLFYFYIQPSLITWISANTSILNEHGLLPVPMLLVPVIVGLLVVGSVERRIAKWLK